VEHDCSEVFVSAGCIPQEVLYTPPRGGARGGLVPPAGVRGGRSPPAGGSGSQRSPGGGSGAAPPKLKTDVNFPCKSIVISSQSEPFIRRMI
jgi:hypothetical protein